MTIPAIAVFHELLLDEKPESDGLGFMVRSNLACKAYSGVWCSLGSTHGAQGAGEVLSKAGALHP